LITTLRKASIKHVYLIIIAAWLYTISFIATNYLSYNSSPQKVQKHLQSYIQEKEKRFNELLADSTITNNIDNPQNNSTQKAELANEGFGFFAYMLNDRGNPILNYWNSNKYYIVPEDLRRADGNYFVHYQNGDFELVKKTVAANKQTNVYVAIIPVRWDYFIENKYLNAGFEGFSRLDGQYEISDADNALPIVNSLNQTIFKIQLTHEKQGTGYDGFTIVLRTMAIIFLLFFFNALANEVVFRKGFNKGFLFLVTVVFLLRLITYYLPFPFNFKELALFDPSIYASNFLHPSLGDLLINTLLVFWLVGFYKFNTLNKSYGSGKKGLVAYIHLFAVTTAALMLASVIRSLIFDSKISFDVSSFFSLTIYSFISFTILCLGLLSFFHLSHILLRKVFSAGIDLPIQLLVIAVSGLVLLSFNIGSQSLGSYLLAVIWTMLYILLINARKVDIALPILKSRFFIFWVFFFAISVTALVLYQNRNIEMEQRKKYAENLALQADPASENLLSIAATNFSDSFLVANYPRLQSEFSNKFIKDSLINENFSGYLNKYDTRIYTFDSLFHPMFNDDSTSYAIIKTRILNQGKPTSIADLYIYETSNQKSSYLYEKKISTQAGLLGYLFVTVKPKRYKSEALYPELFRQAQDLISDFNSNYTHAVYSNGKLVSHYNDYSFPASLSKQDISSLAFQQKSNAGYNELWYNAGNGKRVIVAKKNAWSLEFITLFAYLFCIFLLVISLFHIGNFLFRTRFRRKQIKELFQFNIRSQIHATIIFISAFSFIVIGIATISFFIYRFNQSNEDRLSKSIQVMANQIEEKVKLVRLQLQDDDVLTINDVGFGGNLERQVNEISEVHNVEVNFYDTSGTLIISTQPYIYNKHLLSEKMDPTAYYELYNKKKIHYIHAEKVGEFPFLSIYVPINDDEGRTYAYLNIPYLNSQAELNQEISSFLATLINLNAFIFLLAGAIAFLITNRITSSFSLITQKMKEINLGKINEEIKWKNQDEIGVLVNEYNKMVNKLEQSAKALAQSEREGAWREMARQVAHEIKNPLTPMKLSIQYLQRAIDNNSDNVKELSNQVAHTLVQQIDQLANIAGDFSQFANISNSKPETIDITDIIASLVQLHQSNEEVSITHNIEQGHYKVNADKVQIARLFTNLLKNAIESAEEKDNAEIVIHQQNINNHVLVSIKDNGTGIPAEMQNKIFMPNFTTKTSGTGLGLAICKGIVENANGKIWFETEENKGSTFFVEIPLAEDE
jgi:two-component system nitrogen regulation sensor histidine kinase NtrY